MKYNFSNNEEFIGIIKIYWHEYLLRVLDILDLSLNNDEDIFNRAMN